VGNSKLKKLNLINKLQNAYQCCKACGSKYGVYSVGCSSSWIGDCDVCGLENVSVTETRDYAYLMTGIRKLKMEKDTKTETKEVKYTSKITSVEICREDELVALTTEVKIEDEGGGAFIVITSDADSVRLDFEEFDEVIKAVALLKNQ
jgi:hypothetical protein